MVGQGDALVKELHTLNSDIKRFFGQCQSQEEKKRVSRLLFRELATLNRVLVDAQGIGTNSKLTGPPYFAWGEEGKLGSVARHEITDRLLAEDR